MAASSIYPPNLEFPKAQILPLQFNNFNLTRRDLPDNFQKQSFTQTRNSIAQSMILTNSKDSNPKMVGFSMLDSMARHITSQAEETVPNSSIS
jgi:hypothetical protein